MWDMRHGLARAGTLVCVALAATVGIAGHEAAAGSFSAGGLTFSDELGGFRLLSASGKGTRASPIVIEEVLLSASPVTLVVRVDWLSDPRRRPVVHDVQIAIHLIKIVRNGSGRVWNGFEMELQETFARPSEYGDGLSFGQASARPVDASSDSYARARTLLEPHDRIRFDRGSVDPRQQAVFRLHITDPTPVRIFYLLQDPQVLYAQKRPPAAAVRFDTALRGTSWTATDTSGICFCTR